MTREERKELLEKLIGTKIKNKQDEEGIIETICERDAGTLFWVHFEDPDRMIRHAFPGSFYGGFLRSLDPELSSRLEEIQERDKALEEAEKERQRKLAEEEAARKKAEEEERKRKRREELEDRIRWTRLGAFHEDAFLEEEDDFQREVVKPEHDESVVFSEEEKKVLAMMDCGRNIFLTGSAGSGKSTLLKEFIYQNRDKNVIVCAPTGIAAINVQGDTLHRAFHIDPAKQIHPGDYDRNVSRSIIDADIIIIDEISMCRFDVFEYVVRTCREAEKMRNEEAQRQAAEDGTGPQVYPEKQLVLVGDFYQLPPVITEKEREVLKKIWGQDCPEDGFAFQSPLWKELNPVNIVLHENKRQRDSEFLHHLNNIRIGNPESINWFNARAGKQIDENAISVYPTNKEVEKRNKEELGKLPGEFRVYAAGKEGNTSNIALLVEENLSLKVGMRVVMLANYADVYQNGSLGTVTALGDGCVTVRLDSGQHVEVTPYAWDAYEYVTKDHVVEKVVAGRFRQLPIKAAYAVTVHKTQGQTYDRLNLNPLSFNPGQLYVALSRVRDIENLVLTSPIKRSDLKISGDVSRFYESLDEWKA